MSKYLVGCPITFRDGSTAKPGDVVEDDPNKFTAEDALETTMIGGVMALAKLPDEPPAPAAPSKRGAAPAAEPPKEDLANDR